MLKSALVLAVRHLDVDLEVRVARLVDLIMEQHKTLGRFLGEGVRRPAFRMEYRGSLWTFDGLWPFEHVF